MSDDETMHDLILSELKDIKKDIADVDTKVDGLKDRIFVGNGQESLVGRIDRNSMVVKAIVWSVGVLYIALVTGFVSVKMDSSNSTNKVKYICGHTNRVDNVGN